MCKFNSDCVKVKTCQNASLSPYTPLQLSDTEQNVYNC